MKKQFLKGAAWPLMWHNSKSKFRRASACTAIVMAGLVAGCSEDSVNPDDIDPENSKTTAALEIIPGNTQQGRIKNVIRTRAFQKSEKLTYVATIAPPDERKDLKWSATAVTVENGHAYVVWHSNQGIENGATKWGGAIDVIEVTEDRQLKVQGTAVSYDLKFNHVLAHNNQLFLSATSGKNGATIGRVNLSGGAIVDDSITCIAFPGNSLNAITPYDGQLIGVSGYALGAYATFPADVKPQKAYNYAKPERNSIAPLNASLENFGGKYVTTDENGTAYILYIDGATPKEYAHIIKLNGTTPEDINLETWLSSKLDEDGNDLYGKHVLAVKNDYAYVALGCNGDGILVYKLSTGQIVWQESLSTSGLYVDDNYLYAATGMGLRIYKENPENYMGGWHRFELEAFEVETYDETTGLPTSKEAASVETEKRHSPNFVTVDPATGYIYVAYGKSGVLVYKFRADVPEEHTGTDMGDLIWADENIEGYYAWGEIFHADNTEAGEGEADEEGLSFSYNGTTYTNNASYYPYAKTGKKEYSYNNYHYFNNSTKLTKYTFNQDGTSEDGKTVLEATDDVATMRWGDGWRMPTKEEWRKLFDDCDKAEYIEKDGVKGLLLTAANGNTLFLPETGYYNAENTYKAGGYYYWTSTLSTQTSRDSHDRKTKTGGHISGGDLQQGWNDPCTFWSYESLAWMPDLYYWGMNGYDRAFGFKVRPVKDKTNAE